MILADETTALLPNKRIDPLFESSSDTRRWLEQEAPPPYSPKRPPQRLKLFLCGCMAMLSVLPTFILWRSRIASRPICISPSLISSSAVSHTYAFELDARSPRGIDIRVSDSFTGELLVEGGLKPNHALVLVAVNGKDAHVIRRTRLCISGQDGVIDRFIAENSAPVELHMVILLPVNVPRITHFTARTRLNSRIRRLPMSFLSFMAVSNSFESSTIHAESVSVSAQDLRGEFIGEAIRLTSISNLETNITLPQTSSGKANFSLSSHTGDIRSNITIKSSLAQKSTAYIQSNATGSNKVAIHSPSHCYLNATVTGRHGFAKLSVPEDWAGAFNISSIMPTVLHHGRRLPVNNSATMCDESGCVEWMKRGDVLGGNVTAGAGDALAGTIRITGLEHEASLVIEPKNA